MNPLSDPLTPVPRSVTPERPEAGEFTQKADKVAKGSQARRINLSEPSLMPQTPEEVATERLNLLMEMGFARQAKSDVESALTYAVQTISTHSCDGTQETVGMRLTKSKPRSLTLKDLPTELLRLVLYEAAVDSPADQRVLLAVCSCWRDLLIKMAHLWTTLRIWSVHDNPYRFERLLRRLDLQLERCGSLMLDVHWRTILVGLDSKAADLFLFLARRAPFPRWKSLVIEVCDIEILHSDLLARMGTFCNLTSLKHQRCQPGRLLKWVNESVTSKLTHFELHDCGMRVEQFNTELNRILSFVSETLIPQFDIRATVELPENIKAITSYTLLDCSFPHITSLTTLRPNPLRRFKSQHLPRLEYLSTSFDMLEEPIDAPVRLELLTILVVSGFEFEALALMTLPNLRVLRINAKSLNERSCRRWMKAWCVESLSAAFDRPEMGLTPTQTLELNVSLPPDVLVKGITRMGRRVKELVVWMNDAYEGWEALRMFIRQPTPSPPVASTSKIPMSGSIVAPYLQTLKLQTRVVRTEEAEKLWRSFMNRILEERQYASLEGITLSWGDLSETKVTQTCARF
ncbi:SubName: Full=Uncharacterized protein {ECO:0000313/EMBL:CCA74674.1} [Serendipita indica DSM 11827]|nr:SubName: Full=Uncharacterized protein {ECO:0000313/EMBL:CCA74674.1} [Serendipita indica DSM 11827]